MSKKNENFFSKILEKRRDLGILLHNSPVECDTECKVRQKHQNMALLRVLVVLRA
jgi:hypothetical protein